MKTLLITIFALSSFALFASTEKICVVQEDSTYAILQAYDIACNYGKSTGTKEELPAFYIPALGSKKRLAAFMTERGLTERVAIKLSNKGRWSISAHDYDVRVFTNRASAGSEWAFVRKDSGTEHGPRGVKIYSFDLSLDSANGERENYFGYTEEESKDFFSNLDFKEVLGGENKDIHSRGTIHLYKK